MNFKVSLFFYYYYFFYGYILLHELMIKILRKVNENLHLKIKEDEELILSLNSEIDNNKAEINQLNKEVKVCTYYIFIKLYLCVEGVFGVMFHRF